MTNNITLINAETGEQETRAMTTEEFNIWKESADKQNELEKAEKAQAEAQATAKAALLEKLGISSEEASLLLS